MKFFYNSWLKDILWLLGVITLFYFYGLGNYPLFVPDEGRYSEVAFEMIKNRDFITPTQNGLPFFDKPILHYWLQIIAMFLFGINEWAIRFFPALLGMVGCLITYVAGRHLFDRRTGILSAIILATSPLYFVGAHYANLDLEIAVFISSCLLFFILALKNKNKYLFLLAYCCSAIAVLTKGLIGIVLPVCVIGCWLFLTRQLKQIFQIHLSKGILLWLAITLPWYILVQQANPAFLHYFFVTQHFNRFLSTGTFNNPSPSWFYLPIILIGFFPWSSFIIPAIWQNLNHLREKLQQQQTEIYLLLWIAIIVIFFSIPHSKIVTYILPIAPALALLIGRWIATHWEVTAKETAITSRITAKKLFFVMLIMVTPLLFLLVQYAPHLNRQSTKPLVLTLQKIIKPKDQVFLYYKYYQDVPLYLKENVYVVANWQQAKIKNNDNWQRELWLGLQFNPHAKWLIDENVFWKYYYSNQSIFIFINQKDFARFKKQAKHYYIVDQYNNNFLISNQILK